MIEVNLVFNVDGEPVRTDVATMYGVPGIGEGVESGDHYGDVTWVNWALDLSGNYKPTVHIDCKRWQGEGE